MIVLGIESTAHTFGVGIIDDTGKILANAKSCYTSEKEGIHPSLARKHHEDNADLVITKAVHEAGITLAEVDLISFSMGPGLPPCLVVGMQKAKQLSEWLKKPLIGINHCIAHLEIGRHLTGSHDPLLLYVSGANTQVIAYEGGKFRIFGETLDMGCGNFIDSFARYIGLGFPGGPKIQKLAENGSAYIELPYVVKGMDTSFSGMLTNLKQKYDSKKYRKEDLAYSLQETTFAMLLEVAERAMHHCKKDELVFGGGVCCNSRFQEMAKTMCEEAGFTFFTPERNVLVDNGAMIAWQGFLEYRAGTRMEQDSIDIMPNWRTDAVEVNWR